MYGKEKYGMLSYAIDEDTGGKSIEYYTDLMVLVPEFMAEIQEMHELYVTEGYEIGYLQHIMEEVLGQCFIATATWGLTRWEKILGMETNLSLTYEQRREILMAKLMGQGTTTKEMIKQNAAIFSGSDVDVIEDNVNNLFIVRFIGTKGIPRNMQAFINMLEEIKPAHLAYRFEYRYTVWNELKRYIWNDIGNITWDDVRILKEE